VVAGSADSTGAAEASVAEARKHRPAGF
jgi:hypothetical protein